MDQSEQTWSETAQVSGPRIWRTAEVGPGEAFDYYHEGICSAFMPLRPELERSLRHGFQATHYAYGLSAGTLNVVSAQSHLVQRGRAEIAASSQDCYYLNFQLAGDCRISQNGSDILLLPGDVGLFDSSQSFGLHHDTFPELKVASLMLPKHSIGGDGGDHIDGGAHRDRLYGQDGDDTIIGGDGSDYLYGGNGNDDLNGGGGVDVLSGNSGADRFIFEQGFGRDAVQDFDVTEDQVVFDIDGMSVDDLALSDESGALSFTYESNGRLDTVTFKGLSLSDFDDMDIVFV